MDHLSGLQFIIFIFTIEINDFVKVYYHTEMMNKMIFSIFRLKTKKILENMS